VLRNQGSVITIVEHGYECVCVCVCVCLCEGLRNTPPHPCMRPCSRCTLCGPPSSSRCSSRPPRLSRCLTISFFWLRARSFTTVRGMGWGLRVRGGRRGEGEPGKDGLARSHACVQLSPPTYMHACTRHSFSFNQTPNALPCVSSSLSPPALPLSGPIGDVLEFVESLGFVCPDRKDFSSFLLEVVTPAGVDRGAGGKVWRVEIARVGDRAGLGCRNRGCRARVEEG
jgi:hypothetical protein